MVVTGEGCEQAHSSDGGYGISGKHAETGRPVRWLLGSQGDRLKDLSQQDGRRDGRKEIDGRGMAGGTLIV